MKTLAQNLLTVLTVALISLSACTNDPLEMPTNPGNGGPGIVDPGNGSSGSDDNGGNNNAGSGLHADVPVIAGLSYITEMECNGGLKKVYRNSSDDYHSTALAYADALKNAGFTKVNTSQGGGWGPYGGRQAWGYKGSKYVKVNVQVQDEGSVVYVCAWASKPADDDCDDD